MGSSVYLPPVGKRFLHENNSTLLGWVVIGVCELNIQLILEQCGDEGHWLPTPTVENPHITWLYSQSFPSRDSTNMDQNQYYHSALGNCCWECESTVFHWLVETVDVKPQIEKDHCIYWKQNLCVSGPAQSNLCSSRVNCRCKICLWSRYGPVKFKF